MRGIFFSFFLLPFLLHADIPPSSVSSEKAFYDGNSLLLNGKVKLDHALGQLQSQKARLLRTSESSPFTSIHLQDDVVIALKNCGKIFCANANFDFHSLKGKITPKRGEMIHFVNLQTAPLSLSSKRAEIAFSRDDNNLLKVERIEVNDTVQMQWGKDFFLTADKATYSNTKHPYLWASPHCVLTHYNDFIEADRIEVLPESAKLILSTPSGRLTPSAFHKTEGMQFSCNKLIWEKAPQILTLKGNICIQDSGIGDIFCEDEVELKQKQEEGKWILSGITAKGTTKFKYHLNADFTHLLVCYGLMKLDQDRLVLTLESPPEEPLEYFHDKMKLSADYAELKYQGGGNSISAEKLFLSGNIQLTSSVDALRCAMADQYIYYPEEQKMILSAQKGNCVLFWDQEQELSISAKEVHITHTERGENIKGVGNVRFAFSSAENALLKKVFPFYQPEDNPE